MLAEADGAAWADTDQTTKNGKRKSDEIHVCEEM